jgi:transposase-like protein
VLQAENGQVEGLVDEFMRGVARYVFVQSMLDEVDHLCGGKYLRGKAVDYYRGGSSSGVFFHDTHSESISRPRVRRRQSDGSSVEVPLMMYGAGKRGDGLREAILRSFVNGISGRKMEPVHRTSRRTSKSEVSRIWQSKAGEYLAPLRGRSLAEDLYVGLMLDGVVLSEDLTAVVALGITADGEKRMLDFEIGSSENNSVCLALTGRLVERGLRFAARRPLAILDGSKALRQAVLKHWPDAAIQTCLVHVARRLRGKLSRRHQAELERLFKTLREASDLEAAREAYAALFRFVSSHSAEGRKSLEDAGEEMMTLFGLGVPDTFNKPLLSTNSIENSIRNMRRLLGRVGRWRAETEMPSQWISCSMLEAEKGFQRIQGYRQIPLLVEALNRTPEANKEAEKKEWLRKIHAGGLRPPTPRIYRNGAQSKNGTMELTT